MRAKKKPSNPPILPLSIKARTCLGWSRIEVVMSGNKRPGIKPMENRQQLLQPFALAGRTGIGRIPIGIKSALVTNTDRAMVQTFYMGTHLAQQARVGSGSVGANVKMVTGCTKTPAPMVVFQLLGSIRPIATGGRTVDHDKADTFRSMTHPFDLALQDGFADGVHGYMHDWSPKAPKRVATTVAITFNTMPQTLRLGFSGSGLVVMVCCIDL